MASPDIFAALSSHLPNRLSCWGRGEEGACQVSVSAVKEKIFPSPSLSLSLSVVQSGYLSRYFYYVDYVPMYPYAW